MTHHPAPYSKEIIDLHRELLKDVKGIRALDPYAGTGRVLDLLPASAKATLIEIEPEWMVSCTAAARRLTRLKSTRIICGDSAAVLVGRGHLGQQTFTHIITSPDYGNRFADGYRPTADCRSYAQSLKRPLSAKSTSQTKFRPGLQGARYRLLHKRIMTAAVARLGPRGEVWLNMSDFYATLDKGAPPTRMLVTKWWIDMLYDLGLVLESAHPIYTKRFTRGENRHRVPFESLLIFTKE